MSLLIKKTSIMLKKVKFEKSVPFENFDAVFRKVLSEKYHALSAGQKESFVRRYSNRVSSVMRESLLENFLDQKEVYSYSTYVIRSENVRVFSYLILEKCGIYLLTLPESRFLVQRVIPSKLDIHGVLLEEFEDCRSMTPHASALFLSDVIVAVWKELGVWNFNYLKSLCFLAEAFSLLKLYFSIML